MSAGDLPPIDTRAGFVTALRWGFERATAVGSDAGVRSARRIVCCDTDFADWPLDDPAILQGLTAWLRLPLRRLVLLAEDFDGLVRRQPRFCAWRRDWMHAVEAWQPALDPRPALPTVLCSDSDVHVQLIDRQHWRGHAAIDVRLARQRLDALDAVLQHSTPALASRPLGL